MQRLHCVCLVVNPNTLGGRPKVYSRTNLGWKPRLSCISKSWGNSKEWMLQLLDGRQLVLPLSLYRSLECRSVCSNMEGESVPGISSIINEGQRVSWANESDGLVDSLSVVLGLEDEIWEFDERLMTWERGGEPLVVVPLATKVPLDLESSPMKELGCKESVVNN